MSKEEGDEAFTDELEALSAIFGREEFTSFPDTRTCTVRIAECELMFEFGNEYPATAPMVSARPINAECSIFETPLAESRLEALISALKQAMASLLGSPLVYDTILAAQEWLQEHPQECWQPQNSENPPKPHQNAKISTLKRSGGAKAGALSKPQAKAVPSLQIMCLTFLLQHASRYDTESRAVIGDSLQYFCELSRGVHVLASAMQAADDGDNAVSIGLLVFAGLRQYPRLCNWVRQQVAVRPKLCRALFGSIDSQCRALQKHASTDSPACLQLLQSVEAVFDAMLGHGRFKRELEPPLLTKEQSDLARKTKKLVQSMQRSKQGDARRGPSEWARQQRQRAFGIYARPSTSPGWRPAAGGGFVNAGYR